MTFIVINTSNNFDPIHQMEFATAEEADAHAREIVTTQPQAVVRTAQLINTYTAKVTITSKPVQTAPDSPAS